METNRFIGVHRRLKLPFEAVQPPTPKTRRARDSSRAPGGSSLSRQQFVPLGRFELVAIRRFLAGDAELGPGHSFQALGLDLLFAMQADSVAAIGDAQQRAAKL